MNVFIRAKVRIFSFGERLIVSLNSAIASLNGTINLSPHENIPRIAPNVSGRVPSMVPGFSCGFYKHTLLRESIRSNGLPQFTAN